MAIHISLIRLQQEVLDVVSGDDIEDAAGVCCQFVECPC